MTAQELTPTPVIPEDDLVLGDWRVGSILGSGGMSAVYGVIHRIDGTLGVAKVLLPQYAWEVDRRKRFMLEAQVLTRLRHPNVVALLDTGSSTQGRPFLVMEAVAGGTLADHLRSRGALEPHEAVGLLEGVLKGLGAAHEIGIIHRDLKPQNVFLSPAGVVKLGDFGLALELDSVQHVTATGQILGTPLYMSPEQCLGNPIDARSDLYGVGCVLYEMLSGSPPFGRTETPVTLILKHVNEPPPPLRSPHGELPNRLVRLVLRLLAKDPDERPQWCEDVLDELRRAGLTVLPEGPAAATTDLSDPRTSRATARSAPPAPSRAVGPPGAAALPAPPPADEITQEFYASEEEATLEVPRAGASVAPPDIAGVPPELGRWRVQGHGGRGGFGRMYRVEHTVLGRKAMAKVPGSNGGREMERFRAHARGLNSFRHPNVVEVLDIGEDQGGPPYMIVEELTGETVLQRLQRTGPLDAEDAAFVAGEVAAGLAAVHQHGIVHRDVKPAHIMLGQGPVPWVKLVGFGIARFPEDPALEPSGTVIGTPYYMSPEQVKGLPVDGRSDLYSLGATLYQMLAGSPPFEGSTPLDICLKQVAQPPPSLSAVSRVPPAMAALVEKLLAKDPAHRPQSADEVVEALAATSLRPPAPSGPVDLLRRAGLTAIVPAAESGGGLLRFRARDADGPVTAFVGPARPSQLDMTTRLNSMRFLARERPALFVPIVRELDLGQGQVALLRRDPVPPPLPPGRRWEPAPALAVAAVAFRALTLLRLKGRRSDNFTLTEVRAHASEPAGFACVLQPPLHYEEEAEATTTLIGGHVRGDSQYLSPGQIRGEASFHDSAYAAGVLLYTLLAGKPPFEFRSIFEMAYGKAVEDPPSIRGHRPDLPDALATWLDALIARDPSGRARPPQRVDDQILGHLAGAPDWADAVGRVLAAAPLPDAPAEPPPSDEEPVLQPLQPGLSPGQRVSRWEVREHLHFGGEAEIYRVEAAGRKAILKLWYDEGIDPLSPRWKEFREGMRECGRNRGFPALLDEDVFVRGRPRPWIVFEEVEGERWRRACESGERPAVHELLEIAARLLEGVAVAQRHFGCVGDLSASNVLLRRTPEGREPVLLDVAMPGRDRSRLAFYGTPGYVAPEVANGAAPDARSDLFSVGILLLELALGRRLYPRTIAGLSVPVEGFDEPLNTALGQLRERMGRDAADAVAPLVALDPARRHVSAEEAARSFRTAGARAAVRTAATQRTSSTSRAGLERRLPRPVAQALRAWRLSRDPLERVQYGFGLGEVVARFLALVLVADYLSDTTGPPDPDVEQELRSFPRHRTLGSWVSLARTTSRAVSARREPFVAELAGFFVAKGAGEGLAALNEIVPERNRAVHGRPVIPEGELPALMDRVDDLAGRLVDAVRFLGAYPLLSVVEQRTLRNGRFELGFLDLQGPAPSPEQRTLVTQASIPSSVVALCRYDFGERLLLDPFLVHRACPRCGSAHTYMSVATRRTGELRYLDLASGHEHEELPADAGGTRRPFDDVVAQRAELALQGAVGTTPEEAQRYWAGEAPFRPGQVLGKYVIEDEIGRGSMGVVFRATYPDLGGWRAMKVVRPDIMGEDRSALLRRLAREARMMEKLGDHEGIVRVHEFGTTPDESTCYLVMELLDHGSLDDRLRRPPLPSLDEVRDLLRQLHSALAFVHTHGIVHRDLKPSNVLYSGGGRVKIADFGVARDLRGPGTTILGFVGALTYSAPEQLSPERQSSASIGPWTDWYAFGLVGFDLLRGRPADMDAARRADALRQAVGDLARGSLPEDLAHHADIASLLALLQHLGQLTQADYTARPKSPSWPGAS